MLAHDLCQMRSKFGKLRNTHETPIDPAPISPIDKYFSGNNEFIVTFDSPLLEQVQHRLILHCENALDGAPACTSPNQVP